MQKIKNKNTKGSILAYSLIILAAMVTIVAAISASSLIEKKSANSTQDSVQAYQTADSGVQLAVKKINEGIIGNQTIQGAFSNLCTDNSGVGPAAVLNLDDAGLGGDSTYDLYFYNNAATPALITDCNEYVTDIGYVKSVGKFDDAVRSINVSIMEPVDVCDLPISEGPLHEDGLVDARGTGVGAETNTYDIVAIAGRCWMAENLRTTKRPDGTNMTLNVDYFDCSGPADGPGTCPRPYGHIYDAVRAFNGDSPAGYGVCQAIIQGICPDGWHLPSGRRVGGCSADDFWTLKNLYSSAELKSTNYWNSATPICSWCGPGTNTSELNMVPAGRNNGGIIIIGRGSEANFLSSGCYSGSGNCPAPTKNDITRWTISFAGDFVPISANNAPGVSIRCVKDPD